VAAVFFLARRLLGPGAGLLSALLLAVSAYDIVYARSALSESDANLLFTAGVLLWSFCWVRTELERLVSVEADLPWRLAGAVAMGAAFTANYRTLIYIAVVVAFDLVLLLRWRTALVGAAITWGVGLLIFPLAWQAIGLTAQANGHLLFQSEITSRPTSYLAEALYQIHQGKQAVLRFDPTRYAQWFVARQSWPVAVLLVAGVILAAVRRTTSLLLPALLVAVPYVVYVFAPFIVPRNLDTAIPFASILAAAALIAVIERAPVSGGFRTSSLAVATLVVCLAGGVISWRLTAVRSGFAEAAGYLARHGHSGAIVGNEIMLFYLRGPDGSCRAEELPTRLRYAPSLARSRYPYAVVDVYDTPIRRYLLRHGDRVARFLVLGTQDLGENPVASENGNPPGPHQDQHVDIYWVAGRGSRSHAAAACSLTRVV
jgi:hypothetical protein